MDHTHHHHHTDHGHAPGARAVAASATLHCLTGCAIGEILGLLIGTAIGLSAGWTIALAVGLAFLFGYALSTLPLLKAGVSAGTALSVVLAADTLSIATMELVDNGVMALVPGAMEGGLVNVTFWVAMMVALSAAFAAAYPVNLYLLQRGKGHALLHEHHGHNAPAAGLRRLIPSISTSTLAVAIVAFMVGGLVVSAAGETSPDSGAGNGHASAPATLGSIG